MKSNTLRRYPIILPIAAVVVAVAIVGCQTTQSTRPDAGTTTTPPATIEPVVDVTSRRAKLAGISRSDRNRWCDKSWGARAFLARKTTIHGPIRRQQSNARSAGNALFANVAGYYAGEDRAANLIRDTLEEGAEIGAFTELSPCSPAEFPGYNPMNEPVFQVANFLIPLAHAYLVLEEAYPEDEALLGGRK